MGEGEEKQKKRKKRKEKKPIDRDFSLMAALGTKENC
jgi:hypothetical protein